MPSVLEERPEEDADVELDAVVALNGGLGKIGGCELCATSVTLAERATGRG